MQHSNATATETATATHLDHWRTNSHLVLRSVFDPARITALRGICDAALEKWKRESRPEVEPGEQAYGPKAWMLPHLNHPKYHQTTPGSLATLLSAVADPALIAVLRELLRGEPFFMQSNYYVNPDGEAWRGIWHRDAQFLTQGGGEEVEKRDIFLEAHPPRDVHVHIPLVPSEAFELVPGSHNRWDTPEEHQVRRHDAFSDKMPGVTPLRLNPGDAAILHVNSIHRGLYDPKVPRRTIAVTWSTVARHRPVTRKWLGEWKGYIAHFQPWFLRPGYLDGVPEESRHVYEAGVEGMRSEWEQPGLLDDLPPERRGYFMEPSRPVPSR